LSLLKIEEDVVFLVQSAICDYKDLLEETGNISALIRLETVMEDLGNQMALNYNVRHKDD